MEGARLLLAIQSHSQAGEDLMGFQRGGVLKELEKAQALWRRLTVSFHRLLICNLNSLGIDFLLLLSFFVISFFFNFIAYILT